MGTEISKKKPGKKITVVILILISAFVIYYSIMSMMSPGRKLTEIQNEFNIQPAENKDAGEIILSDTSYLRLLKEKSFLQSRIALAETDSIYLTLDLEDSTANIEISGVVVLQAKMKDLKTSSILLKGDENSILSMLAKPFVISGSIATIEKDPVMVKMAPKDTSEYIPSIMPDTSVTKPVNYILELTNGARIYVYQQETDKPGDRMNLFMFDLKDRCRDTWNSLKRVAVFKVPEYHPFIKMKLTRADAKRIYRALPKNGQIAVLK